MNKVIMVGRIATDPEMKTTAGGVARCAFRIAVARRFKNSEGKKESDFFSVLCWRQTADFVCRYFAKGDAIAVEGSLQTRTYDAQDGTKRYVTEINAEHAEFVGNRESRQNQVQPEEQTQVGFVEVDDGELPF